MTEEEVRRLLDARTATIDPPPAPLREITRLGTRRQRRQRILQVGGAAALVAAVALGGVGLRSVLEGAATAPPSSQQPSELAGQPPTADQLYGDWRAVSLFGHRVGQLSGPIQKTLIVSFFRVRSSSFPVDLARGFTGLGWRGSDSCNTTSGTEVLGENGSFRLQQASRTLVGCPAEGRLRSEAVQAILHTNWVRIVDGRLVLYASSGHELARFVRASAPRHHVPTSSGQPSRHRQGPKTLPTHSPPPN